MKLRNSLTFSQVTQPRVGAVGLESRARALSWMPLEKGVGVRTGPVVGVRVKVGGTPAPHPLTQSLPVMSLAQQPLGPEEGPVHLLQVIAEAHSLLSTFLQLHCGGLAPQLSFPVGSGLRHGPLRLEQSYAAPPHASGPGECALGTNTALNSWPSHLLNAETSGGGRTKSLRSLLAT